MSGAPEEFDWLNDPSIVQREASNVAVYANPWDMIVVRQERRWDEEDDTFIIIDPRNASRVTDAITRCAGASQSTAAPPARRSPARPPAALLESAAVIPG